MTVTSINISGSNASGTTYTLGHGGGGAVWGTGPVYNTSTAVGIPGAGTWMTSDANVDLTTYKPIIHLNGKEADIVLDGKSLKDSITAIEDRLAILKPNPQLEAKWTRLRELREEYQRLEKEIIEKETAWNALK